ncbi:putative T7SS-secreted protein [Streptomyces sp. NPDC004629]|uniref:putative T7SS-secreted protein n=1 Tax=Streptomyces sp. NPDC004629 TaxID=3364705 RepID=UPI0036BF8EF0
MTTAPGAEANPYPHLGFDPAPGDTHSVRDLHKKLASCAKVLEETHGLVTQLMDGSHWKGDAAVAFREELRGGPLALNLRNAAHSVRKAAGQLVRWEGELDDFQRRAGRLDADARDAWDVLDKARRRASRARSSPALGREAGPGHDDAQKSLTQANAAVAHAQADLDAIIRRARKLAEEHEEKARHRATKIQTATKKLAPQTPPFPAPPPDLANRQPPRPPQLVCGVHWHCCPHHGDRRHRRGRTAAVCLSPERRRRGGKAG